MKNPFVESVVGDHTQLFTERFIIIIVHEAPLSFGLTDFLAYCMCRFRTRSRTFAFGWLVVVWEWLERTLGVLRLFFDAVILSFRGMI